MHISWLIYPPRQRAQVNTFAWKSRFENQIEEILNHCQHDKWHRFWAKRRQRQLLAVPAKQFENQENRMHWNRQTNAVDRWSSRRRRQAANSDKISGSTCYMHRRTFEQCNAKMSVRDLDEKKINCLPLASTLVTGNFHLIITHDKLIFTMIAILWLRLHSTFKSSSSEDAKRCDVISIHFKHMMKSIDSDERRDMIRRLRTKITILWTQFLQNFVAKLQLNFQPCIGKCILFFSMKERTSKMLELYILIWEMQQRSVRFNRTMGRGEKSKEEEKLKQYWLHTQHISVYTKMLNSCRTKWRMDGKEQKLGLR